tara:strand:- start:166581 stop:166727 length:147 start_codon:yes stop_codon:yes gene_type:complete
MSWALIAGELLVGDLDITSSMRDGWAGVYKISEESENSKTYGSGFAWD